MVDQPTQEINTGGLNDLVSTQKGGVQTLAVVAQALVNAFPKATASTSPVATGLNSIATAAVVAIAANTLRHGIMFHNPGTATIYVYPTSIAAAPTVSSVGGSFVVYPGGTLQFSPANFPNVNCGWSAFGLGASLPLTICEFY